MWGNVSVLIAQYYNLLFRGEQPALIEIRRAQVILFRAKVVATVFAVLTPLWIPVDLLIFPGKLGIYLAILRAFASIAFILLVLYYRFSKGIIAAHHALGWLLMVPTVFFLASQPLLSHFEITGQMEQTIAAGYSFLPFVMISGLSVFPITAFEGASLCIPMWLANLLIAFLGYHILPFETHLGVLWLLGLLSIVATLAGMSQLHFMQQMITQSSHDGLTAAYNRQIGEELMEVYFSLGIRLSKPFTLAFVDLDNFKSVNDLFGHDEGDVVLKNAAIALRHLLRQSDILIRWGGEEFLVVMPNTDMDGAHKPLARVQEQGLGLRPDGNSVTASIGVSERVQDDVDNWEELVEKADRRMYMAKQTGKNRIIYTDISLPEKT